MVLGENPQGRMSQTWSNSQGGASLHIGKLPSGHGQGNGRARCNGKSGKAIIPC
jgi:hypothetical protein